MIDQIRDTTDTTQAKKMYIRSYTTNIDIFDACVDIDGFGDRHSVINQLVFDYCKKVLIENNLDDQIQLLNQHFIT